MRCDRPWYRIQGQVSLKERSLSEDRVKPSDAAPNPGTLGAPGAGRGRRDPPLEPVPHLDLRLWPPGWGGGHVPGVVDPQGVLAGWGVPRALTTLAGRCWPENSKKDPQPGRIRAEESEACPLCQAGAGALEGRPQWGPGGHCMTSRARSGRGGTSCEQGPCRLSVEKLGLQWGQGRGE